MLHLNPIVDKEVIIDVCHEHHLLVSLLAVTHWHSPHVVVGLDPLQERAQSQSIQEVAQWATLLQSPDLLN